MPYRCYFFIDDHIRTVEELPDCYHDDDAREIAIAMLKQRKDYSAVEVWDHERKVYGLPGHLSRGASADIGILPRASNWRG